MDSEGRTIQRSGVLVAIVLLLSLSGCTGNGLDLGQQIDRLEAACAAIRGAEAYIVEMNDAFAAGIVSEDQLMDAMNRTSGMLVKLFETLGLSQADPIEHFDKRITNEGVLAALEDIRDASLICTELASFIRYGRQIPSEGIEAVTAPDGSKQWFMDDVGLSKNQVIEHLQSRINQELGQAQETIKLVLSGRY
ncbi:MAG: hypothetical protein KKF41_15605 [Actinobacteria bacterium]|nr:hypothetical protein [Actinomycetota bacterium]MBU1943836.1 hypothetical protein [Actinomycetota bacterium]MBU2689003.1 hypothetical protein [Actinomycetota bacterium]